jgi:hypothetical protein
MADDDGTPGDAEGEDYGSFPAAVSLITEGMKLDRVHAEAALRQMVVSGHVRARGHTISEARPSSNSTVGNVVYRQLVRLDFNRGSYSLADVRREIRKVQIPEGGGEQQQSAASEAQPQSRKGVGGAPGKYDWNALGAAFGAWLHNEPGRADERPKVKYDAVRDLAVQLGMEPPTDRSIQPYVKTWVDAYRRTLGSPED